MSGLSVINSIFSGIGAGFASKMNFASGLALAALSLVSSYLKKLPVLSTKFSILSLGGNLIRGPLHIFDSIFSTIGEEGAKYTLPSILAGAFSLFSLNRTLKDKDNKNFEVPFDTISGTLGRTAIHHVDSMLASKAAHFSHNNNAGASFIASLVTTLGVLLPKNIRTKKIPWNTLEGFVAQGSSHYIDSIFANIGNSFGSIFSNHKNALAGTAAVCAGAPLFGHFLAGNNYQIPFGTLEGRLVRGIFHAPENFVFNLGTTLGNSHLGIPLSFVFCGLTYLTCLTKKGKSLIKNFEISRDKTGGLIQRLPFQLIYSLISASGTKLGKLLPAPLLAILGPALSFQIGEKFKNTESKFDDMKGLMLRNSVHLWETMLSSAAYRTGRMLTGTLDEKISSGSILSDGRWLSDEGRIVPTMAIGKQGDPGEESSRGTVNRVSTLLSIISGVTFAFALNTLTKQFLGKRIKEETNGSRTSEIIHNREEHIMAYPSKLEACIKQ